MTDPRRDTGALGERLAREHFERLGYRTLATNYRTRFGELDLVLADETTIVFCEVKARRSGGAAPLEGIRPDKQLRVRRMAAAWLAGETDRPRAAELRFDAVGILLDAEGRLVALDHVEAAF